MGKAWAKAWGYAQQTRAKAAWPWAGTGGIFCFSWACSVERTFRPNKTVSIVHKCKLGIAFVCKWNFSCLTGVGGYT